MEIMFSLGDFFEIGKSIFLLFLILGGVIYALLNLLIKFVLTDLVWPAVIKLGVLFRSHVLAAWEKHYE